MIPKLAPAAREVRLPPRCDIAAWFASLSVAKESTIEHTRHPMPSAIARPRSNADSYRIPATAHTTVTTASVASRYPTDPAP